MVWSPSLHQSYAMGTTQPRTRRGARGNRPGTFRLRGCETTPPHRAARQHYTNCKRSRQAGNELDILDYAGENLIPFPGLHGTARQGFIPLCSPRRPCLADRRQSHIRYRPFLHQEGLPLYCCWSIQHCEVRNNSNITPPSKRRLSAGCVTCACIRSGSMRRNTTSSQHGGT